MIGGGGINDESNKTSPAPVKLVLKYWVAMRLGCDELIIKEHASTHRIKLSEIDSIFLGS